MGSGFRWEPPAEREARSEPVWPHPFDASATVLHVTSRRRSRGESELDSEVRSGGVGAELTKVERAVVAAGRVREAEVDRGARRTFGVVHTPPELARHVVAEVDGALRAFGLGAGLADPRVTIVDPSCGPGVFLAAALARAPEARLVGLDVDAGALRQARSLLPSTVRLLRRDTLASLDVGPVDVAVVLGNPPWAGRSSSRTELLTTLLEDFRREADGSPLAEKKIGVLSDAYVRFLRWGAEVVRRAPGGGVLGFVTNASWLDGPVHRGMRAAMARFFRDVRVLDLGGSALTARAGGERDENVFGVRPSVCVTVATRPAGHDEGTSGRVQVACARGTRQAKLAGLASARFVEVRAEGPWRVSRGGAGSWPASFVALDAIFPFHREGVQTNRDAVVIDRDRDALLARLQTFALGLADPRFGDAVGRREHFDPERARREVAAALRVDPEGETFLRPLWYRPFDRRWLAALPALCHRPRPDLQAASEASSLCLVTVRKDRGTRTWNHVALIDGTVDNCFLSSRSSCRSRAFPTHGPDGAENLSERGRALAGAWGAREMLLHAATWLSAAAYREGFAELLATDYPRVPPPSAQSVALGEGLARAFLQRPASIELRGASAAAAWVPGEVGHVAVQVPSSLVEARAAADAFVAAELAALRQART